MDFKKPDLIEVDAVDLELVESTRKKLDEAIQAHMASIYDGHVVVDWFVGCDLASFDGDRLLGISASPTITAWCLRGLSYYTASVLDQYTS